MSELHRMASESIYRRLHRGEIVELRDGKLYALCSDCGGMVRMNKPIVGSLHFCTDHHATQEDETP